MSSTFDKLELGYCYNESYSEELIENENTRIGTRIIFNCILNRNRKYT